jgi:ribosomal protein S27E
MKISDVTCASCGALYLLAESASVDSSSVDAASNEACTICGSTFASGSDGKLRAFRFVMSPSARPARTPLSPTISP